MTPGAEELLRRIWRLVEEKKGRRMLALEVGKISSLCTYFLIASGSAILHVKTIAEHVIGSLKAEGIVPHHVEGLDSGIWVLLDYGEVVVNLFLEEEREYYALERLWSDAPLISE